MTAETSKGDRLVNNDGNEHAAYDNPMLLVDMTDSLDVQENSNNGYVKTEGTGALDATGFLNNSSGNSPICLTPKLLTRQSEQSILSSVWCKPRHSTLSTSSVSGDLVLEDKDQILKKNLTCLFSFMYAMFVLVLGGIMYMYNKADGKHISEVYNSCIAILGLLWLLFLHVDLHRYKREIIKEMGGLDLCSENVDEISANTELVFSFTLSTVKTPSYRFLQGRHSGSFYLKCGMAAFCFGHLIHEGLQLGQQIPHFLGTSFQKENCLQESAVVLHIVRPIYSFYQLFMIFKYSNIVINRYISQARFGLMHVIATCLCFWFNTIVEDTHEYYQLKQSIKSEIKNYSNNTDLFSNLTGNMTVHERQAQCAKSTMLSNWSMQASPYLYPFTIEFNLLLAGVWIIMWQNIGLETSKAHPHHFSTKISTEGGTENVTYQSNLVISADCHASNKGLFAGLFLLLITIITVIIFFVSIYSKGYRTIAIAIHTGQEGVLTSLSLLVVIVAYHQISKLDVNLHPITFLDDILLFIPLPFFFINCILSMVAEFSHQDYLRMSMHLLIMIQVVVQTPLIVDGLRRCSNSHCLRYKKPGREIVTFLIICNLTMWIVNTFEIRNVEQYYNQGTFYGELTWLLIGHTTLPLMLFYRFHSSVCLADIWKSGYEKGE